MLRHLLKLTWKRKSRNLMLSAEILLAFVIVFAIAAFGVRYWQLYHLPVGFQHQQVWSVNLQPPQDAPVLTSEGVHTRLVQALKAMPQVEDVAFASFSPYQSSTMTSSFWLTDKGAGSARTAHMMQASDGFWQTLGMQASAGRWPGEQDEGSRATPAVINRSMARQLFGDQSPLEREFAIEGRDMAHPDMLKVVGVIEDFRNKGEYMTPQPFVLVRHSLVSEKHVLGTILLKLRPGTPRDFEEQLQRQLKQVRNDWGYRIAPLTELRPSMLKMDLVPLMVLSVIAAFLLAMVFFGLFGALWQNTTRRIPEIGLRRALGAGAADIYRQIIAEQMLLSTAAMLAGLALLVQLPLTGALGDSLNWAVFGGATALSMAVIYLISLLCSLYPGWRASRLHPAAALHYE